jgi:Domain of unknown function (DUF4406)
MSIRVYVSGPMTGIKDKNYPAFMKAAVNLRRKGIRVVNPAELDIGEPRDTWEECLRRDIKELMRCNAVATLRNWKHSKGALLEVYIAKALKWPVHPLEFYLKRSK